SSERLEPIECPPHGRREMVINGQLQSAALYYREKLPPGAHLTGPALIIESFTTTILDPGWCATVLSAGELLIETESESLPGPNPHLHPALTPRPTPSLTPNPPPASTPDPILLELFNNHLTSIATQMGITLRNTSMSVNVKERLDFSCAI